MGLRQLVGVACTAGIGFTVALFISALAYTDPAIANQAKIGIFAGSIVAALVASLVFLTAPRSSASQPSVPDGSHERIDEPSMA